MGPLIKDFIYQIYHNKLIIRPNPGLVIHISFAIMEPFSGRLRYPSNNSYEFSEGRMEVNGQQQSRSRGILSISTHSITLCNFEGGGEIHSLAVAETRPA